jgi:hypothetical protein
VFSKIFLGLVLTTAFMPDMYSAEAATAESPFSPEITMLIKDAMAGKNKGSKETIKGFSVEKLDDQTAPNGELLADTRSKIDEVLTAEKYPDSGHYFELIKLDGLDDVYRVVSFTFNKDATNVEDKITNVQEIALVEIKKSGLEEHAHQVVAVEPAHEEHRAHVEEHAHQVVAVEPAHEEHRAHVEEHAHQVVAVEPAHEEHRAHVEEHSHQVVAVEPAHEEHRAHVEEHAHQVVAVEPAHEEHHAHAEEHAHRDVAAEHNHDAANRSHEHSQGHVVSALASPSLSDHLGNLFSANRVHSEEHVHAERVHSNEHLHQERTHH